MRLNQFNYLYVTLWHCSEVSLWLETHETFTSGIASCLNLLLPRVGSTKPLDPSGSVLKRRQCESFLAGQRMVGLISFHKRRERGELQPGLSYDRNRKLLPACKQRRRQQQCGCWNVVSLIRTRLTDKIFSLIEEQRTTLKTCWLWQEFS